MVKSNDIKKIRSQIDEIDIKILNLISDRKNLVTKVVKFKQRNEIVDEERINDILTRLDEEARKRGVPQDLVKKLWQSMIKSFISYEREIFDEVSKKSIK